MLTEEGSVERVHFIAAAMVSLYSQRPRFCVATPSWYDYAAHDSDIATSPLKVLGDNCHAPHRLRVHATWFKSFLSWQQSGHPSHDTISATRSDRLELRNLAIERVGSWNIYQFRIDSAYRKLILSSMSDQFRRHRSNRRPTDTMRT